MRQSVTEGHVVRCKGVYYSHCKSVLNNHCNACFRGSQHVGTAPVNFHESVAQTTYGKGQPLEWQMTREKFTNTVPKMVSVVRAVTCSGRRRSKVCKHELVLQQVLQTGMAKCNKWCKRTGVISCSIAEECHGRMQKN